MFIKRLIVALLAIAMLTPTVTTASPHTFGTPEFQKMWFRFDSNRGVWLDYSALSDNICRIARSENWRDPLSGIACWEPTVMPGSTLIIPQSVYASSCSAKLISATMRTHRKKPVITNEHLAEIASTAADAMSRPGAFTCAGLSFDARGRPADVFECSTVSRDALGWILKKSCETLQLTTKKKRQIAYHASELINNQVLRLTGRSLVAINDEDGREAVIRVLKDVAKRFATS